MDEKEAIHQLIDEKLVRIAYQPVVDLASQEIYAFEALARPVIDTFTHPMQLIDAAVEVGRMGELGRLLRQLSVDGCTQHPLFLNVRPEEFNEGWLVQPDDPIYWHEHLVILELTESAPLSSFRQCVNILNEARVKGIRLAVDDLGSGYSNLTYLADFTPEIVKIDIKLVQGIQESRRTFQLVKWIVRLCEDMGARVVAEGIETPEQLAAVVETGAHYGQGFLLARPAYEPPEIHWPDLASTRRRPPAPSPTGSEEEPSRVLVIELDDSPALLRQPPRFAFERVRGSTAAITRLRDEPFDCVVVQRVVAGPTAVAILDSIQDAVGRRVVPVCLTASATDTEVLEVLSLGGFDGFIDTSWPEQAVEAALTAAVKRVERGRKLAIQDDLTRLYNRRHFDGVFKIEHERCKRYCRHYSMVMIDLDGLKDINLRHGHPAGSLMIQEMGRVIDVVSRTSDLAFRYGGDEFVVLLTETEPAGARRYAERLRAAIGSLHVPFEGNQLAVTASIGVASFPDDGSTQEEILKFADDALFEAKARGKNRVE